MIYMKLSAISVYFVYKINFNTNYIWRIIVIISPLKSNETTYRFFYKFPDMLASLLYSEASRSLIHKLSSAHPYIFSRQSTNIARDEHTARSLNLYMSVCVLLLRQLYLLSIQIGLFRTIVCNHTTKL